MVLASIPMYAGSNPIRIGLSDMQQVEEEDERPSKGYRVPAAPVICTIDFESHRIATSIPYEIIAYELWDEDGTAQIVSFASDYDLVEYMSCMSGAFQLRLVSSERTYVGYIDL